MNIDDIPLLFTSFCAEVLFVVGAVALCGKRPSGAEPSLHSPERPDAKDHELRSRSLDR